MLKSLRYSHVAYRYYYCMHKQRFTTTKVRW